MDFYDLEFCTLYFEGQVIRNYELSIWNNKTIELIPKLRGSGSEHYILCLNARGFPTKHNEFKADALQKRMENKDIIVISETGANKENKI